MSTRAGKRQLLVELEDELFARFKSRCGELELSMREATVWGIQEFLGLTETVKKGETNADR